MGMSNFSLNFLYSVGRRVETDRKTEEENKKRETVEEAAELYMFIEMGTVKTFFLKHFNVSKESPNLVIAKFYLLSFQTCFICRKFL
jgi:hypothetical protein